MTDSVTISGLTETVAALRALPTAISGKNGGPLRKALFAAAKVIKNEVIQRTPVDTGTLKSSIATFRDRHPEASGATERYTIGIRGLKKKYALTKANIRKRRAGKSYTVAGASFYAPFVEFGTSHAPAHPFFRPAFEATKEEAVQVFAKTLAAQVAKAAERARQGAGT